MGARRVSDARGAEGRYYKHIQLSGWLSENVEYTYTKNGKAFLKTEITAHQSGGNAELLVLEVTRWINVGNSEQVKEAQAFHQGDEVVITGKLTMRRYSNRVYIGIEATSIQ